MLEQILKNLWYKELEIKIFLTSASLWISPASTIAKKTWIKRTTCYQILESLCQRNIMKQSMKSKMKFYEAVSIDELSILLKNNIEELQSNFSIIEQNKQELEKLYQKNIWDTKISFYEGFDDIKHAYNDILNADDEEIYSISNRDFNIKKHPLKEFWDKYFYKRIEMKKMSYTISSSIESSGANLDINEKKFRETLTLPESMLSVYWDVKVSWKHFVIVSQNEWRIFGVAIKNREIANMFKSLIKEVWQKYER